MTEQSPEAVQGPAKRPAKEPGSKRYFRLLLEYDGSDFHGWQIQPTVRTVQGTVKQAIERLTRSEVIVFGASRTDRGVHALGQVARAEFCSRIPAIKMQVALNNVLPGDVRAREACECDAEFHPRFQARGKHYRYLIDNRAWASPLNRRITWHRHEPLDHEAMHEAAQALVGEHDFVSFASKKEERSTTRRITEMRVRRLPGSSLIAVDVAGDGFLWNMVRIIVGTLVDVGRAAKAVADMPAILAAKHRRAAGPTAPPQGLFLMKVFFDQSPRVLSNEDLQALYSRPGSSLMGASA